MSYFKRNPWLLPIIGGLIALISLFTPTTYNYRSGVQLYYVWMNQLAIDIWPNLITPYLLRTDLSLVILSISLSVIIFVSTIVLITSTNIFRKTSRSYQKLKWVWLLLAILIIGSTLIWIIYMEIFYNISGASHWQNYRPHFGVIGPFIGAGLIIIGTFLVKKGEEGKETDVKSTLSYLKKKPILFSLIGSFIVIVAIFTPTTVFNLPGNLTYVWMNQLGYRLETFPVGPVLWRFNLYLVLFTTALTLIIFASALILITSTSIPRKNSTFNKKWLITATLIVVLTLTWIIYMEIVYQIEGYSHWQSYNPHFGVIGPFIGSALIIVGALLSKKRKPNN